MICLIFFFGSFSYAVVLFFFLRGRCSTVVAWRSATGKKGPRDGNRLTATAIRFGPNGWPRTLTSKCWTGGPHAKNYRIFSFLLACQLDFFFFFAEAVRFLTAVRGWGSPSNLDFPYKSWELPKRLIGSSLII